MDSHAEISEFLTSRRAKLTPEIAGLPDFGGRRRVPGLRREEVALLAGMSSEYYKRLERGNAAGVSDTVLLGISRALQLNEAEHEHLLNLVRAANVVAHPMQRRALPRTSRVRSSVQQMVDALSTVPVYVQNGRLDCVLTNRLGRAVFSEMFVDPRSPMNAAHFGFLDPRAETFYRDLTDSRRQSVALLRREAGRNPTDKRLTALIGELSTRSEIFRSIWSAHDVKEHRTGVKRLQHPTVGALDLSFESMDLASEPGLQMIVFSAAPESASYEALTVLAGLMDARNPAEPYQHTQL